MGKITAKHYLNTNLKPVEKNGKLLYPVYLQLIYNRFSTNKRSKTEILTTENSFELYLKTNNLIKDETIFKNSFIDETYLTDELNNTVNSLQIADKQNIKIERKLIFKAIDELSLPVMDVFNELIRSEYSGTITEDIKHKQADYERFIRCFNDTKIESINFIEAYTGFNLKKFIKPEDSLKFSVIELISTLFFNYSFAEFVNSDYEKRIRERMKDKTISEFDEFMKEVNRLVKLAISSVIEFAYIDSTII